MNQPNAFVPGSVYLSISETYVGLVVNPSGGLGKPPLPAKIMAGGSLPATIAQNPGPLSTTFTSAGSSQGGDFFRPYFDLSTGSDLIIRHNVDATGQVTIFAAKYDFLNSHVWPDTMAVILSSKDATSAHYTGLAGQTDATISLPSPDLGILTPLTHNLTAHMVNEFRVSYGRLSVSFPSAEKKVLGHMNRTVNLMGISAQYDDALAICASAPTLIKDIAKLQHAATKAPQKKLLQPLKRDALTVQGACSGH